MIEEPQLIKENFIPKSSFIFKVEYSYFMRNDIRMTERITIFFSDGMVIEYQSNLEEFETIKTTESVGKYWHKNMKQLSGKIIKKGIKS